MRRQPLVRIGDALERRAPFGDRLAHRALEQRDQQVVLAAEVEVDRAGRHAGGAGDVGHLRLEEAVAGEDLRRGFEDRVALVGDGRPGRAEWRDGTTAVAAGIE